MYKLICGNKAFSSWSLRAWLTLKKVGVNFDEVLIKLDQPNTKQEIATYSPAGMVPVMIVDNQYPIWDSLAINLYMAEQYPQLWPTNKEQRALAYSICCEMHSSFYYLRKNLSSHFVGKRTAIVDQKTQKDIDRIIAIWKQAFDLSKSKTWLFNDFTIADTFFAPVAVGRFLTYDIKLPEFAANYCQHIYKDEHYQQWLSAAEMEK